MFHTHCRDYYLPRRHEPDEGRGAMHELFRKAAALEDPAEVEAQLELGVLARVRAVRQVVDATGERTGHEPTLSHSQPSLGGEEEEGEEEEGSLCLEENGDDALVGGGSDDEEDLILEENGSDDGDTSDGEGLVLEENAEGAGDEEEEDLVLEDNR